MTAEGLVALAGVLLSLIFRYVPKAAPWFEAQSAQAKASIMLGLVTLVAGAVYGLSCYGPYTFVACDSGGVWELAELWVKAVAANQVTHVATSPFRPHTPERARYKELVG